ncbi:MAG: efflux RND transporter periplasmic adaptor subunit [Caulobacteraceae bacterium]|nr:efflux RND transporter periplasmic adaptor subunit [Caulobacteraceae bacterium]
MTPPRRFRWGFAVLGVLLVALIAWAAFGHRKPAKRPAPPPVAVAVARVQVQDVQLALTELGAAQAWQGVTISPQVSGRLTYVAREGADVAAGDVLAEIDPTPYRAVLTQAQGSLRRDRALLQQARVDLARYQALGAQDSIARQQVDSQAALVKQDEGVVQTDEGTVAAAQVNVNFCRITAPVSGRVGVRLIDVGNVVSSGAASAIISVNQIVPIAVTFTVPQSEFQRLSQASNAFTRPLGVEALSQDSGISLGTGELSVADNHVDASTGTVELKARFPNASRQLWPGQFVNVRLGLQTLPQVMTVPAAAVNRGPNGPFVYVVGPGNVAVVKPVVVAAIQDAVAVIQSGLAPGMTVVTDGQMSLKQGSAVAIHPSAPAKKPAA